MAKITGNKNGLITENQVGKKSEPLITISKLKETYLFGVIVRNIETGEELGEGAYRQAIDTAVSYFEHILDISIYPVRNFVEYKDYRLNDYAEYGYMQLENFPVHAISSLKLVYYRDDNGEPETTQEIPKSWMRLNNHDGILRLVPNGRMPSSLQISSGGTFFPEIFRSNHIPHAWQITYDYGFCSGQIPVLLNQAIGMLAAIIVFITAGHLILGAGIAGSSISVDSLSQSIQTTQSAENSGFSATIKDLQNRLFGATLNDQFAIVRLLKDFYKGSSMTIL